MPDNDLIRRGDAKAEVLAAMWARSQNEFQRRLDAIPAVTVDAPSLPEVGSVIRALDSVISEMHHLRAALRGLEDRG